MALLRALLFLPVFWVAFPLFGQSIRDTTISLVAVQLSYAQQFPGGDMADRFGTNSNIGVGAFNKWASGYLLGAEGSFLFGNKVVEPGILRNVINSEGQIVDVDGEQADVFLYERGWTAFAVAGKLLPVIGPNPNSGLLLKVGGGYMRHKVRVQTQKNVVPQLEDEYLEGYDRLSAGPAALAYIGYQHFGNKGRINFHLGVEVMAGFTNALRSFNFDTEQFNTNDRVDLLTGIRVGWSLPIYRKVDTGIHYY
ncbi:MAG: hypothetical protein KDC00_08160 [Flavobacteriales bacterium]|nr:hypothetical protein [Flavobacteriales bacterium]